jgi:hypothetical protein
MGRHREGESATGGRRGRHRTGRIGEERRWDRKYIEIRGE